MPSYNIFLVDPEKKEQLLTKFESVGLKCTFDQIIDENRYRFYFCFNPIDAQIDWLKLYADFLHLDEEPKIKSYFGVFMIQLVNGSEYAISLGKSHFYLAPFCVYDFGLQLAERIFADAKVKHGKHFSSRRNKTIVSYGKLNDLNYESGEAIGFVRGSTNNKEIWGKTVSFGQSVRLSSKYTPSELTNLLVEIDRTLELPPRIHLPRAKIIEDAVEIQRLDSYLAEEILGQRVSVEMDEFTLNSVYFVFLDDYSGFQLDIKTKVDEKYYARRSKEVDSICGEDIKTFLLAVAADGIQLSRVLDDIKVKFFRDGESFITRPLKELLEVATNDWCCLMGGKWMKFSQDYIAYLKDQVGFIQVNIDEPIILKKNLKEVEDTLIDRVVKEKGYTKLHKTSSEEMKHAGYKNVEIADMKSTNCLYFIKLGNTQDFSYVLNQSLTTVSLYRNRRLQADPSVEGIRYACIWLIFDGRVNDVANLSELNSITFLIALNDWIMAVKDAGFTPVANISYRR